MFAPREGTKYQGRRSGDDLSLGAVFVQKGCVFQCALAFSDHGDSLTPEHGKILQLGRVRSKLSRDAGKLLGSLREEANAKRENHRLGQNPFAVVQCEFESISVA